MNPNRKEQAFLDAISENRGTIAKLCAMYAKDEEGQKDLEQEVMFNLWKSFENFRQESKMSTWLYRIILNVCLKHHYTVTHKSISTDEIHVHNGDNEHIADLKVDLKTCIQQLEFVDKSLILLYLEDMPYAAIGDVMGITENHVAVKIKRIRAKLGHCMKKIQAI